MKRNSLRKYFTLILLFFTVAIGFSSWIIVGEKNVTLGELATTTPVCYINTNESGNQYTRIEKALEVANSNATSDNPQVVYVVPNLGFEVKIYKDCTIGANVTLCLPHTGTTYYDEVISEMQDLDGDGSEDDNETTFIDSTIEKVNLNRVTYVIFNEFVEMTILSGGKLFIGGQFGREGQTMSGQSTGLYCEIGMRKNSKIISNGNIQCYGYIKELDKLNNDSILELKKGSLKCPFVIYDYKGGSATSEISSSNICPFDMFDIPNLQVKMRIYSGVNITAELRMVVTMLGLISQEINFIGNTTTNTMLSLTSGYMDWKYTPSTIGLTKNDTSSRSIINLYGDMCFGSIQISVGIGAMGLNIDTDNYFLPLSYKLQINVESNSNLDVDKKVKMMPGCKIIIKSNSNVNINSQVILYPSGYTETSTEVAPYPSGMDRAKLYCNGILTITETGVVAGIIDTSEDNAILGVNSSSFEVTSAEYTAGNITSQTQAYIDDKSDYDYISETSTYISKSEYWIKFDREFILSYYQVLTDKTGQFVYDEPVGIDNPTDPSSLDISDIELLDDYDNYDYNGETYRFIGWYYDAECNDKIDNNTIYGTQLVSKADSNYNVKLYARWSLADPIKVKFIYFDETEISTDSSYIAGDTIETTTLGIYSKLDSSNEYKMNYYEHTGWTIIYGSGDALVEVEIAIGTSFDIPEDFAYTEIIVKANQILSYSKYKIVNSSVTGLDSVSVDGTTISFTNNEYWVDDGVTITVTIKADYLPFYAYTCYVAKAGTNSNYVDNFSSAYSDKTSKTFVIQSYGAIIYCDD